MLTLLTIPETLLSLANNQRNTHTMNQLISYTQTSYGTYKVIIEDAHGDHHTVRTNDVEAIDRIREAGRMTYNDAGMTRLSYEALRNELADCLAAVNNI